MYLELAALHLAEIKQLVDQQQQTVNIEVDHIEVFNRFMVVFQRGAAENTVQWRFNQGEWSADFMGDIGEEADFRIIRLPLLLLFVFFHVALVSLA